MTILATILGIKINKCRKEQGLTLESLAKKAGLSKSYLWELENRDESQRPNPSAEKLDAIAETLELPVSFFLENDVLDPEERHEDEAFFRGYKNLEAADKKQLRKILKVFKTE